MKRRAQPLERLLDAGPVFVDTSPANTKNPNRRGIGIQFYCPIHEECLLYVPFANPLDGGEPCDKVTWKRTGETFVTLTLAPSIRIVPYNETACGWHGYIRNGFFVTCDDAR